jgi:hypothetical protein
MMHQKGCPLTTRFPLPPSRAPLLVMLMHQLRYPPSSL